MEKRGKIDRGKIRSDTEYIGKKASIQGWIGPMFLRHSTYLSIFDDPSNGYGWISWISAEPPVIEEMRSLKNNETKMKLTVVSRDLEHFGNPKIKNCSKVWYSMHEKIPLQTIFYLNFCCFLLTTDGSSYTINFIVLDEVCWKYL